MVDGSWNTDKVDSRLLVSILVWAGHCGAGASARSGSHHSQSQKTAFPMYLLGRPRKNTAAFIWYRKVRKSDINTEKERVGRIKICFRRTPNGPHCAPFPPLIGVVLMFHPTVVVDGPRGEEGH